MIALALLLAAEAAASASASATPGTALAAALKAVKQDGAMALSGAAQEDVVALLPSSKKGEECPDAAKVSGDAHALKDRGGGALLVVEIATCKGARVFALANGAPPRIARLLDLGENEPLHSVRALAIAGGKRENDLAVELMATATVSELRFFSRGDSGFGFRAAGALRDFSAVRECASGGGEDGGGWASYVRPIQDHLAVLRIDGSCGGAPWQASCLLYRVDQGQLSRGGVCTLPPKLEAKALRASGWK